MTIAQEAQQATTREERGLKLYRTHGARIHHMGGPIYTVPSQDGTRRYLVEYGAVERCSCSDHLYRHKTCVHLYALGVAMAKGDFRHPEVAAGDPFIAGGKNRPRACNDGWVSLEVETDEGTAEEVLYLCQRCASEAEGLS